MSLITRIILEAETVSAREAMRTAWRASMAQAALRREPAGRRSDPRANTSPTGAGAPTGNNSPGQPVVHVVGRARAAKPIRSVKSRIVPEPDQVQSEPASRRSTLLEPPGF